jgi:hypothetical protein
MGSRAEFDALRARLREVDTEQNELRNKLEPYRREPGFYLHFLENDFAWRIAAPIDELDEAGLMDAISTTAGLAQHGSAYSKRQLDALLDEAQRRRAADSGAVAPAAPACDGPRTFVVPAVSGMAFNIRPDGAA